MSITNTATVRRALRDAIALRESRIRKLLPLIERDDKVEKFKHEEQIKRYRRVQRALRRRRKV